jgi:hypothetical protein
MLERKKTGGIVWFCTFLPEVVLAPVQGLARLAIRLMDGQAEKTRVCETAVVVPEVPSAGAEADCPDGGYWEWDYEG